MSVQPKPGRLPSSSLSSSQQQVEGGGRGSNNKVDDNEEGSGSSCCGDLLGGGGSGAAGCPRGLSPTTSRGVLGGARSGSRRAPPPLLLVVGGFLVAAQAVLLAGFLSAYWRLSKDGQLASSLASSSSLLLLSREGAGAGEKGAAAMGGAVDGGAAEAGSPSLSSLLTLLSSSPLLLPVGQPPNLPRIEAGTKEKEGVERGIYGGGKHGDGKHLGGFTEFDPDGIAPLVWSNMMLEFGVRSVMDVGCGRGVSTRWFLEHNAKVLCVEGSRDAITQSFLPPKNIVEHDYSRGPWWPLETYDAAWSVEFLEHVSRQYMHNYMQTLRKAAIIMVSSSRWGGWHHVEIHNDEWWIRKFESHGFLYDATLTQRVREWAAQEGSSSSNYTLPTGDRPRPQHVFLSMKVFLNPAVASLPAHAHLFPEDGCLGKERPKEQRRDGVLLRHLPRKCGTGRAGAKETPLPDSYRPPPVDVSMHERWIDAIRAGITVATPSPPPKAPIEAVAI
jgi:SAM-dependent methyltransferase